MSETKLVIAFDARIGNLERQLERTSTALRRTDQAASRTKASVASIGTSVSASLGAVSASLSSFASGTTAALSAVTRAVAPLAAVLGTLGVGAGIGAALQSISSLADEAGSLGMTANELLAIRVAFQEAGGSAQQATTGITKFAELMGEAAQGNREAMQTLFDLNVAYRNTDGSTRTVTEGLEDLITKINSAGSLQEKLSLASSAVGARNARTFVAAIEEMGGSVSGAVTKLREMGLALDENTAPAIDRLGTVMNRLGTTIASSIGNAVATSEPQIRTLIENITQWVLGAINAINGIASGWRISSALQADTGLQALQRQAAPVIADLTRLQGNLRTIDEQMAALEARGGRRSVLGAALGTEQTAEQLTALRRQAVGLLEDAQRAGGPLLRQLEARRGLVSEIARVNLPGDVVRGRGEATYVVPTTRQGPGRPPPTGGSRTRPVDAELRDALRTVDGFGDRTSDALAQTVERINETGTALGVLRERFATVGRVVADGSRPLTELEQQLARTGETLIANATNVDSYTRLLVTAAGQSAEAWRAAGLSQEEIGARVNASLDTVIANMARAGQVSEDAGRKIRAAVGASPALTAPNSTFGQGFRDATLPRGAFDAQGRPIEGVAPTLDFSLGQGAAKLTGELGSSLLDTLDSIADKSKTAGEAFGELAASFARAVARMVAQAVLLATIQRLVGAIFSPTPTSGTSLPPGVSGPVRTNFGGFRMAGGPVSAGMSYIVGERGPEVFTPSGSGRITANGAGQGPQLIINNNAPGVVVTQTQVDERTVIAAVNLSRTEVTRDYQRSMRTGHGPYAEGLSGSFNVRRRL